MVIHYDAYWKHVRDELTAKLPVDKGHLVSEGSQGLASLVDSIRDHIFEVSIKDKVHSCDTDIYYVAKYEDC